MQKKLLAIAVAGALAAPAAAMAQSAVTIYGTVSFAIENASATGGDGTTAIGLPTTGISSLRSTAAAAPAGQGNTSGVIPTGAAGAAGTADLASRSRTQGAGSNFGIRVREDLGGSMYTWLQAELTIQATGVSPVSAGSGGTGPTYRNTGLALGSSAWGDVVLGMWDTPFNVNMNPAPQHAPYANASTNFSSQLFGGGPWGQSQTNSGQTLTAVCNSAATGPAAGTTFFNTAASCLAQAMSFHRRQSNTIQYWSPSWSGFQVKAMYGVEDLKQANNLANGATTAKPSMWSGSLSYSAGPLYIGAAYERHKDFVTIAARSFNAGPTGGLFLGGNGTSFTVLPGIVAAAPGSAAGLAGDTSTAWNLNGRYTFGAFTVGAYYETLKWSMNYEGVLQGGELTELKKKAWGLEGAFVTGPHTVGLRYARAKKLEGSTAVGAVAGQGGGFNGDDSGATAWIFGYAYSLSKRTSLFGYHTRVTNDTNARYQGIVFSGLAPAAGGDPKYTGVGLRHTF